MGLITEKRITYLCWGWRTTFVIGGFQLMGHYLYLACLKCVEGLNQRSVSVRDHLIHLWLLIILWGSKRTINSHYRRARGRLISLRIIKTHIRIQTWNFLDRSSDGTLSDSRLGAQKGQWQCRSAWEFIFLFSRHTNFVRSDLVIVTTLIMYEIASCQTPPTL